MIIDPSRHISGIYNYCDRWCERCPYTSRCGTYEFGKELEEARNSGDPDDAVNQIFWKNLDDLFPISRMLTDDSEEEEIESETPEPEPPIEDILLDRHLNREMTGNHECAQLAHSYMEIVSEWFKTAEVTYEESDGRPRLPRVDSGFSSNPGEVTPQDALEVVNWFQHFIWVKLMRALPAVLQGIPDEIESYDANGSAKIALIAMERSCAAWYVLARAVPSLKPLAIRAAIHLSRLVKRTDETFPDARAFVRPGFDTNGENPPEEEDQ